MHRRRTYALALATAALVAGTGAASPSPSPTPTASVTQSDGTLQILTYRGFAEYGGVSPRFNWVGDFEKETGCRIAKLDTVQTAEDMAAQVRSRPYDLISAGPALAGSLIAAKQVQPVDVAKVAGYDDLDKRFRDMTTVSGKVYGVPYLWGYHEFVYDPARVKGELKEVFASDRAALRDSPMTIADAALAAGEDDDPYALTEERLDAAVALLERAKERTYWSNPLDLVKGFATGKLDYAQATPYYRSLLQKAGKQVKTVPAGETTGWVDSWMLGANVPDTSCAYRWLNWMAAPEAQRDAAAWVGLAPANDKACKGRARQICRLYGVGDAKRLSRVRFAERPPADCRAEHGGCPGYDAWTDRWRELAK
ncbi:spermidine/putrescine ABC transporter periplasmic substrate-binding protein [Nonomuraea coxensis DSM 45129]|uniref:Spermidine/putrescine ABC transporter periplasmic substrate-binding protein n=1 Tax=Nonomuraea coxensis DSM 45129 TaxID=1122611 RepID=A0ABX8TW36_9ACTN|nr:extracellular solute-binding protein [Nonomuraea coxensis]QYC39476.1 spermidine/putrescine ABC transporter periplasmic substrate-binding protein [Nonomuraea coxensis DSM 45129]